MMGSTTSRRELNKSLGYCSSKLMSCRIANFLSKLVEVKNISLLPERESNQAWTESGPQKELED